MTPTRRDPHLDDWTPARLLEHLLLDHDQDVDENTTVDRLQQLHRDAHADQPSPADRLVASPGQPVSRIVGLVTETLDVRAFADLTTRLEAEHGPGLVVRQGRHGWEIRTPGRLCGCITCDTDDRAFVRKTTGELVFPFMIVCETCGNKRCPHAAHHDLPCTGSNEPGQPGSAY